MIFPAERSHQPSVIFQRARRAARARGLTCSVIARVDQNNILVLQSPATALNRPRVLLSSGIHGDEPAAPEALLQFLESSPRWFARFHFTIFPCLNPWGLQNNSRFDEKGRDLNRMYADNSVPALTGAKAVLERLGRLDLALCLHEDYDGAGMYVYELTRQRPFWAEKLLAAARPHIGPDLRSRIDGRKNNRGAIRRRLRMALFKKIGLPEAVWLHTRKTPRVYTIESPSEFALDRRVAAQRAALEAALRLL